ASASHVRLVVAAASLPGVYKERLLALDDSRISKDGVLVIKAQRFRTQEKNRDDAQERLAELIRSVMVERKTRKPTAPSKSAKKKRIDSKTKRGQIKQLRGKPDL